MIYFKDIVLLRCFYLPVVFINTLFRYNFIRHSVQVNSETAETYMHIILTISIVTSSIVNFNTHHGNC